MAIVQENNTSKKVDAYLNISVVDKQGNPHKVGRFGIQLSADRLADRSIINAQKALKEGEVLDLSILATCVVTGTVSESADLEL